MSIMASFLTALVLVGMMMGPGFSGDDLGAYLTEHDGRKVFKEPLTLREEQGGIAGITGTLWTVEPSGQWRVARFRQNKDGTERLTPLRSGELSPAQLEGLAKTLAAQDLVGLPDKMGREAKVNPHRITIKFGQKAATLEGLPARRNLTLAEHIRKSAPAKEKADAGLWMRFTHVVQAVESHCEASGKP
jgi:hypothetical protein